MIDQVCRFIHDTRPEDLPPEVRMKATTCLIDTIGTAIAARATDLSRIIHDFAAAVYAGQGASLWLDGRPVTPPGAALAQATTIDSLDLHDGHSLTKGHAGVAVVPAAVAAVEARARAVSGAEFLTMIAIGYEVAIRAGRSLHATTADYHSSGAWNALGCAAVVARCLRLTHEQTRHALGIAEYNGPRSPMMRCIDYPTMLKDGSGWGAMTGVSAALLAAQGFTGLPAAVAEPDASGLDAVRPVWSGLGDRWDLLDVYVKPYAVCRWAHPAVEGVLQLKSEHGLRPEDVVSIVVETFHEAAQLACRTPASTEAAQYSLPFPVAVALKHGSIEPEHLLGAMLHDPEVLRIAAAVELGVAPEFSRRFPERRLANVTVVLRDGTVHRREHVEPRWEGRAAPSPAEILNKFHTLAGRLAAPRRARLAEWLTTCPAQPDMSALIPLLVEPV